MKPPHYNIGLGGLGQKTCTNDKCTIRLLSYLAINNMETMKTYYPCTWLSFVNQKNEKIRNWSLLMKIISTVPKVLFFKTTDLYTVYLFSEYADN